MSYDRDRAWVDNIADAINKISICISLEMRDQRQSREKIRDENYRDILLDAENQLILDRQVRIDTLRNVRDHLEGLY